MRQKILQKRAEGIPVRQMGRELILPESSIRTFIKHYDATGSIEAKKSLGRRKSTTDREDRILRRVVNVRRPGTFKEAAALWQEHLGRPISPKTTGNRLQRMGYKSYKAKRKPLLTKAQIKRRYQWAKQHLRWTGNDWSRIIWSDESPFPVLYGNIGRRVIRKKNEGFRNDCVKKESKFPCTVQIWGCFGYRGIGNMTIYRNTINAVRYQAILKDHLLPSITRLIRRNSNCIFQQDSASAHVARSTKVWFQGNRIRVLDWPSNSPDLNPNEDLWKHLKKMVRNRKPRDKQALERVLQEEWDRIPQQKCQELVESMVQRVRDVMTAKGGPTKW